HDVDLFAAQFLNHGLHAGSLHSDTRADRIDVGILRVNGDLGAPSGFTRALANLHDAFIDLRHFLFEQLAQEFVGGPRKHDREAFFREIDVEDQGADAVALTVALVGYLVLLGQDRLGAPEIDDHILALEPLNDARNDLALAILELVVNLFALGVADMLDE